MITPPIPTRIVKLNVSTRLPIYRTDVTTLMPIAKNTGIGQVIGRRLPTMILTDDVINFTSKKCIDLGYQTILAKIISTLGNQPAQFRANVTTHGGDGDTPVP